MNEKRSANVPYALAAMAGICAIAAWAGLHPANHESMAGFMGKHILLMNGSAPLLALAVTERRGNGVEALSGPATLVAATLAQLVALWALHAPPAMAWATAQPIAHLAMQGVLFGVALWFWLAVFSARGAARWRALAALLITGKLFCLLAALLVFSPRVLYGDLALADQQMAGLLMLAACPVSYLLAGTVIAARWLSELAAKPAVSVLRFSDDAARG